MTSPATGTEALLEQLLSEPIRISKEVSDVNNKDDRKTVRIFISSTFKDFYNEREVLVSCCLFPGLFRRGQVVQQ